VDGPLGSAIGNAGANFIGVAIWAYFLRSAIANERLGEVALPLLLEQQLNLF
jgi:hypothetical protein